MLQKCEAALREHGRTKLRRSGDLKDGSAMRGSVQGVIKELADVATRFSQLEAAHADDSSHKVTISRLERHASALESQVQIYRRRVQTLEQTLTGIRQKDVQLMERVQVSL